MLASWQQHGIQEMRRKLSAVYEIPLSYLTFLHEMAPEHAINTSRLSSCAYALPDTIKRGRGHGRSAHARRRKDSPQNSWLVSSVSSWSHNATCSISWITPVRSRNGFTCWAKRLACPTNRAFAGCPADTSIAYAVSWITRSSIPQMLYRGVSRCPPQPASRSQRPSRGDAQGVALVRGALNPCLP